jgi:hypothetical protein
MQRVMRGQDWRRRVAEELSACDDSGLRGLADALTRDAAEFLSLSKSADPSIQAVAAKRFPTISQATALLADDTRAGEAKILAIGGCDRSEIVARLGVSEDTIECFEDLFFDVREMKSHTGWVYGCVIRRESEAGGYDLGAKLRLAYCGGAELAKRILDARIDVPADDGDRILGMEMLLHAKLRAVLDMPLSNDEKTAFIEMSVDYEKHKAALNLEKEKLVLQYAADGVTGDEPAPDTNG